MKVGGADARRSSFEAPGVYEFSSRPLREREAALEAAVLATEYIPKEQEEGMLKATAEQMWPFDDAEDMIGSPPRYDQHGNDLASPLAWAIDKSKRKIKVRNDLSVCLPRHTKLRHWRLRCVCPSIGDTKKTAFGAEWFPRARSSFHIKSDSSTVFPS